MNCFNHPDVAAVAFCRACGRPLCPVCQRVAEGVIYCPEHVPITASGPIPASGPVSAGGAAVPPPPPPGAGTAAPPAGGTAAADAANPYAAPASGFAPGAGASGVPPGAGASAGSSFGPPAGGPWHPPAPGTGTSPGLAFVLGLIPGVGAIYNGQYVKGLVHAAIFGMLITMTTHSSASPIMAMSIAAFYFYMAFEAFHTARKRQMGIPVEEWSSLMTDKPPTFAVPIGPIILIFVGVIFLLNSLNLLDMSTIVRFWPVLLIAGGVAMLVSRLRHTRAAAPTETPFDGFDAGGQQ